MSLIQTDKFPPAVSEFYFRDLVKVNLEFPLEIQRVLRLDFV